MTGNDICKKVIDAINSGKYCYWYGGKGEKCTAKRLKELAALYPSIYTTSYQKLCREDIKSGRYCIDCSGLVCYGYGWPGLGTWGIFNHPHVARWMASPLNGMILWRAGHCGIYYEGRVLEARGVSYDLTMSRPYVAREWTCILYDTNISYKKENVTSSVLAQEIIRGKYGNGAHRVKALKEAGYTDAEIKAAQEIVNMLLREGKR